MDVLVTVEEYDSPNRGMNSDAPDPRSLPRRVLVKGATSYEAARTAVELIAGLPVKAGRTDFIPAKHKGDSSIVHHDVMYNLGL